MLVAFAAVLGYMFQRQQATMARVLMLEGMVTLLTAPRSEPPCTCSDNGNGGTMTQVACIRHGTKRPTSIIRRGKITSFQS